MSFIPNQAVTGLTFGLVSKSTGAALTGVTCAIGNYVTKDSGTQANIPVGASDDLRLSWLASGYV
ncbi:MAG: hypothetical protein CMJ82_01305 [Planctomycetaceae bacterium]|nr:hypothetical protein [Planctomycetaceae bacterium]